VSYRRAEMQSPRLTSRFSYVILPKEQVQDYSTGGAKREEGGSFEISSIQRSK
jgi:hypothetical protein